jgi:hypothetical protein
VITTALGLSAGVGGMAIQPDGRIVVGGSVAVSMDPEGVTQRDAYLLRAQPT